jgi:hypothetical protein
VSPNTAWDNQTPLALDSPSSLLWASRGGDGSGKSFFFCTNPGPMFVCGFDPHGMSRVDASVRAGKDIRIGRYPFNASVYDGDREAIKKAARPIWNRFVDDYRGAVYHFQKEGRGFIAWDREDMMWGLRRYAAFGGQKNEGSKTGALDYGDLNEEYVGLINEAKYAGVSLCLIQGLTDKWVAKFDPQKGKMQNYNTGELVPDGFKKIADHVDVTLDHRWDEKDRKYKIRLRKFPNPDEKDKEYADLDFALMASMAFPETDASCWV